MKTKNSGENVVEDQMLSDPVSIILSFKINV